MGNWRRDTAKRFIEVGPVHIPGYSPLAGFMASVMIVLVAVIMYLTLAHCDSPYRSCRDTCRRLGKECGADADRCKKACEGLGEEPFIEFTECVWPSKTCPVALDCWPYEEAPF